MFLLFVVVAIHAFLLVVISVATLNTFLVFALNKL